MCSFNLVRVASGILWKHGYPKDIIGAVLTRAVYTVQQWEPLMEHAWFAVDELSFTVRDILKGRSRSTEVRFLIKTRDYS